jgi:hypothetical protein
MSKGPFTSNVISLTRGDLLGYAVDYDFVALQDHPYRLDYSKILISEIPYFCYDGSIVEQFMSDLLNACCSDLEDYIQVAPMFPVGVTDPKNRIFVFAKKAFLKNIISNLDHYTLTTILKLLAERRVIDRYFEKLSDEDTLPNSDTPLREISSEDFAEYYYPLETFVMTAVSDKLNITTIDNFTWVALLDYLLDYVEDKYSAKVKLLSDEFEATINPYIQGNSNASI